MGFLLSFGGEGGKKKIFFIFPLLQQVLNVFPIAPCFNPICFAQSPPLLTYIGGPKGEALHLSIESSIFVSLHSFKKYLPGPIKFNKKKLDLWGGKGQAKNGDKVFWEEKFHAANGKAQAHTECALHFFLLNLRGGI